MSFRLSQLTERVRRPAASVGDFFRSLLAGVPWSECAEGREQHSFAAPGRALRLYNPYGTTRVFGEERNDIAICVCKRVRAETSEAAEAMLKQMSVRGSEEGDTLEVEVDVPRRWNRRGQANLEVRVPRGLAIEISAVNGRVEIEGIRGKVTARSSNGSAKITDVVGDVEITTSNAKVACACTRGRLVARSSNGKIELSDHRGDVDASTSNGLIKASLVELGDTGVQLATSNGRIALMLPEEVDADVDLRVDNGVIRNERGLCHSVREKDGRVVGRLGAGGALIKLRTSNGSISIR